MEKVASDTHYFQIVSRSSSQLMTTPSIRGLYESARCMSESTLEGFIEWGMREEWDVPSDHVGNQPPSCRVTKQPETTII